jgi:hypothetical protein
MTTNTLHRFRPIVKFSVDKNFIYITACLDKHKEELQSYYQITEEDMEEITKEWPMDFLILVDQVEMSDPNLIRIPMVTHEEYDGPNSSRKNNKEEVHELNNASEETASDSLGGGGGDKVDKEENEGNEDKLEQGKVTLPKDPIDEAETSKKIKVSPVKPSSRKNSKASKPKLQTVLMENEIDVIIFVVSDTSKDILQCNKEK